jgi:hypothetical protein
VKLAAWKTKSPTTISGCRTPVFHANFLSLDSLNQSNGFWHISSYPVCQRAMASCPAGRLLTSPATIAPVSKMSSLSVALETVPKPKENSLDFEAVEFVHSREEESSENQFVRCELFSKQVRSACARSLGSQRCGSLGDFLRKISQPKRT